MPNAILKVSDLDGADYPSGLDLSVNMFSQDIEMSTLEASQTLSIPAGWSIIGIYIDAQLSYADNFGTFASSAGISTMLSELNVDGNLIIAKDNFGAAYLPEWNFDGIGDMVNGQGYQIKLNNPQTITITGRPITTSTIISLGTITSFGMEEFDLLNGWNIITPPYDLGNGSFDIATFFESALSDFPGPVSDYVTIFKDYLGSAYLPEWSFNGIGNMYSGQAYQLKTTQAFTLNFSGDST